MNGDHEESNGLCNTQFGMARKGVCMYTTACDGTRVAKGSKEVSAECQWWEKELIGCVKH